MSDWHIFTGSNEPTDAIKRLKEAPPWRLGARAIGETYQTTLEEIDVINAALHLRRPLLITGKPGSGKSSLAYAVARELQLGPVLVWAINTRSTRAEGLYYYDAIGRLREAQFLPEATPRIGEFITLHALGTALLPSDRPRVLLIDEIDKGDIDLPNDLLHIFEAGEFVIPELLRNEGASGNGTKATIAEPEAVRTIEGHTVLVENGRVRCTEFPFVVLTSNGEREFPPAFLRRCLRLDMPEPDRPKLERIVRAHLGEGVLVQSEQLLDEFIKLRGQAQGELATDQLLNAIFLAMRGINITAENQKFLREILLRRLTGIDAL